MNESSMVNKVITTVKNLVVSEHKPTLMIGQVWYSRGSSKEIIRVDSIEFDGEYYSIINSVWDGSGWSRNSAIGKSSISQYYSLYDSDVPWRDNYDLALSIVDSGQIPTPKSNNVDVSETALVGSGSKELVEAMERDMQKEKRRFELIKVAVDSEINRRKDQLQSMFFEMNGVVSALNKKVEKIRRVIDTIELYIGVNEQVVQIKEGNPASIDDPIHFRQLLRYVDEELAIYKFDIDSDDLEDGVFDEWLVSDDNYKRYIPEQRGIIAFKPRRYKKDYGYETYAENESANQDNFKTYLLIRNGENLYRIYSTLRMSGTLFPKSGELDKILKDIDNPEWRSDKDSAERKLSSLQRTAFALQGLIDRTSILSPLPEGVKIFELEKWGHIAKFIHDGESTLTNGRLSYMDWQKEINSQVEVGSRVLIANADLAWGSNDGEYYNRFTRHYRSRFSAPSVHVPDGIYVAYPPVDNSSEFTIRYMPDDKVYKKLSVWSRHKSKSDRTLRIGYEVYKEDRFFLNYDKVSLDDINYYLYSHIDRSEYSHMIPVLLEFRGKLLSDQEHESHFVNLMISETGADRQVIIESISWWKNKVKWKRPLSEDDEKAMRMIKKRLNKISL